ncbi:MAG: flagellar filament capping protein FliD [Fibrobacter sp.]|nr:flagellar filament capping protein FliD [Fibrobacter sp.]
MGISVNGPSGIDTQSLIDQLVALEQQKVTKVENSKKAYQLKIDAFSELKSLLNDFSTKALALSEKKSFDLFTSTSSDEDAVTITGGTGSVDASYDVRVFQLAAAEKMISTDGRITDQNKSLKDLGVVGEGGGQIKINGTVIDIGENDTIQDLRSKINSAKTSEGKSIGVSASVVKVSDNNFRLVLTSTETGSKGATYEDVVVDGKSGEVLQKLGIIQDAKGDKGNTSQKLTSNGPVSLTNGQRVEIEAVDHNGEKIKKSFTLKGEAVDGYKKQIEDAFNGMVNVEIDDDGKLVIEDKVAGTSQLSISSFKISGTDETDVEFDTAFGAEGGGVLSVGKDAYFSVEGITMKSDTNTASDFMNGVTFNLHSVSSQKDVRVSIERDVTAIKEKFQALVDSYNALATFSKNSTKVKDPNDENSTAGVLSGDSTVKSLVSSLRSFFQGNSVFENATYKNFTLIGLKTDSKTGQYSIDSEMFEKAIDKNLDEVMNLFTKVGVSENSNITLGRNTASTQEGVYQLKNEGGKLQISLDGSTWTEAEQNGEIFSFSEGPATGLSLTISEGDISGIGTDTTTKFTFSKGLGTLLDEAVKKLTDTTDGLIALRQESWQRSMKNTEDRIERMNKRVENYRDRLVKEYSNMEIVMSQMQAQTQSLVNSLGSYSS